MTMCCAVCARARCGVSHPWPRMASIKLLPAYLVQLPFRVKVKSLGEQSRRRVHLVGAEVQKATETFSLLGQPFCDVCIATSDDSR